MDYQIVPITVEYLEGFRQAVDSVAREKRYLAFLEAPSMAMTRDFVEEHIKDDWPHFVAISDNKVVGWCDISSLHRPVYEHCGELGVGVIAPFRGQGIGKALMNAALNKAKQKGLTRIELTVFAHNQRAHNIYLNLGFVVEGRKIKAAKIDEQFIDVICMALTML